jgi:hypothetical protein
MTFRFKDKWALRRMDSGYHIWARRKSYSQGEFWIVKFFWEGFDFRQTRNFSNSNAFSSKEFYGKVVLFRGSIFRFLSVVSTCSHFTWYVKSIIEKQNCWPTIYLAWFQSLIRSSNRFSWPILNNTVPQKRKHILNIRTCSFCCDHLENI